MSCSDQPCQGGGKCTTVTESCANAGHCAAFKCHCKPPFTGVLCEQYKRCYDTTNRCYLTDYHKDSFNGAKEHCIRLGNFSKPVILNVNMDRAFRSYLRDDPRGQLQTDDVWLGARSQPVTAGNSPHWAWLSGVSTSNHFLFLFIATYFVAKVGCGDPLV